MKKPDKNVSPGFSWRRRLIRIFLVVSAITLAVAAIEFPYSVDAPLSSIEQGALRRYYEDVYRTSSLRQLDQQASADDTRYVQMAEKAAKDYKIKDLVRSFVDKYELQKLPVLDIGSGRGYLQDMVEDYTGLDISPTASRFYHKKFVLGSATALPFADQTFDGAWSIWVLEHVPNPEQALSELRRVMRDQGVVLLYPAWSCTTWAAGGYAVRPYSDFGLKGKLIKALIPVRLSAPYRAAALVPGRIIRGVGGLLSKPTKLRYRRLAPNYDAYWQSDSDAVNSIDRFDVMLWFRSRGDECLNCRGSAGTVFMRGDPLIIRIRKAMNESEAN
jgi:SAM-dependent methyltransferase